MWALDISRGSYLHFSQIKLMPFKTSANLTIYFSGFLLSEAASPNRFITSLFILNVNSNG